MIRRPPRSTRVRSSAASDVYKRQKFGCYGKNTDACVIQTEIRPQFILVKIILRLAQFLGVVPPVVRLKFEFAAFADDDLLHLVALTDGNLLRPAEQPVQKAENILRRLGHPVLKFQGGMGFISQKLCPVSPQSDQV